MINSTSTNEVHYTPSLLPMTEQKGARNIVASVIVSGARQNMANYTLPYGLARPVPGPFVCLQATMMDAIALHFMCEIVG
jgi:hypothetical protein